MNLPLRNIKIEEYILDSSFDIVEEQRNLQPYKSTNKWRFLPNELIKVETGANGGPRRVSWNADLLRERFNITGLNFRVYLSNEPFPRLIINPPDFTEDSIPTYLIKRNKDVNSLDGYEPNFRNTPSKLNDKLRERYALTTDAMYGTFSISPAPPVRHPYEKKIEIPTFFINPNQYRKADQGVILKTKNAEAH